MALNVLTGSPGPIRRNDGPLSSGTRQGRIEREKALGSIMAQSGVQRQLRRPPPIGAAPSWRHSLLAVALGLGAGPESEAAR